VNEGDVGAREALNVSLELEVEVLICLRGLHLVGIAEDGGGQEVILPGPLFHMMVSPRPIFVAISRPGGCSGRQSIRGEQV